MDQKVRMENMRKQKMLMEDMAVIQCISISALCYKTRSKGHNCVPIRYPVITYADID